MSERKDEYLNIIFWVFELRFSQFIVFNSD